MITEDYVSFETAKLLKEKGFVKFPYACFTHDGVGVCGYVGTNSDIMRPTLQMAMKWLREKEQLIIMLDFERPTCIEYKIYKYEPEIARKDLLYYNYEESYEEACEAAIKYCLETLI